MRTAAHVTRVAFTLAMLLLAVAPGISGKSAALAQQEARKKSPVRVGSAGPFSVDGHGGGAEADVRKKGLDIRGIRKSHSSLDVKLGGKSSTEVRSSGEFAAFLDRQEKLEKHLGAAADESSLREQKGSKSSSKASKNCQKGGCGGGTPSTGYACAAGGTATLGGGSSSGKGGVQPTWEDKEACAACQFVWSVVRNKMMGVKNANPDLVGQEFDNICQDSPDVFYQGCDEMYSKVGIMIRDFASGMPAAAICQCASICGPGTLSSGSQKSGKSGSKSRL